MPWRLLLSRLNSQSRRLRGEVEAKGFGGGTLRESESAEVPPLQPLDRLRAPN